MAIQPKYHWQFTQREGTTINSVNGVPSNLFKAALKGHGQVGYAVQLESKDSHINLGPEVGQFGTNDFTVAFGMRVLDRHGDSELDIIGSQAVKGHGNFFSVRVQDGRIFFHVDENSKAKHYVRVLTPRLSMVPNNIWFHVAVVRQGRVIQIYIDGALAAEAESKTGVAKINNTFDVKLGHSRRGTPKAQYEDLRIYQTALSPSEIAALLPPVNRPLSSGEIELVATNKASIILNQDIEDLSQYSEQFQKLRLGPDTGTTLYKGSHFEDTAQKLYADLPNLQQTKLGTFPRSVQIWSSSGEPFTGQWVIKAPNGQYLSRHGASLATAPQPLHNELFVFHYNINHDQAQLIPATEQANLQLKVEDEPAVLLIDDSESDPDAFSIVNPSHEQWLSLNQAGTLIWTQLREDRAIFIRAAKFAKNESQVGELAPGEVALYRHVAYHGQTWILSNRQSERSDHFTNLSDFQGLNDQTSSIRLGPDTGVTLFRNSDFHVSDENREKEIEDIVDNVPTLFDSQIGNDTLSSIKIFQSIDPSNIFTSYTSTLSQDYRMAGDTLEEFSAYRTILRLEPDVGEIEVFATDLTTIEVDGETYRIDEQRSATLRPNAMNRIMITSEADGIDTPGLKFHTQSMAPNARVVIFPNQDVHRQIAKLEDGALWNATDAKGDLIVDHKAHSKEEVAKVQNTIKRMMGAITYADQDSAVGSRSVTTSPRKPVQSSSRVISGAAIENHPWELDVEKVRTNNQITSLKNGSALLQAKSLTTKVVTTSIQEKPITQDEFTRLLSQSTSSEKAVPPVPSKGFQTNKVVGKRGLIKSIGRGIKSVFKKAKSVVIGVAKGIIHVLVKTVEGVIDFVVDTVKKVVEFVEAVVETVVKVVKKFIEFLQFLFNWDDILDTQKYLVQAINDGFDYTAQQIDALKGPVSNFIDDLQETVEGAMNQLVTALGGDPSEVREGDTQLPEAVEWFLSKLLGGSQKDDAEPTPQSQPTGDSKLESFLFHFQEAFLDGAGAVLRGFEGLGETIATLISNPLKPQLAVIVLVETLRDVVIQLLEAVENLALGFLDAIAGAIEQLKKMLNTEIKIPFISALFRLIGAGRLTPLNLTGLLVAIPATVVSKLLFGETPFKNEPSLDFAAPISTVPLTSLQVASTAEGGTIEPAITEPLASIEAKEESARKKSIQQWGNIGLLSDVLNGLITAGLDIFPEGGKVDKANEKTAGLGFEIVSLVLSGFSWLASFPSSPNFPGGRPYNVLAHKVSKSENEQEYWERVMWGWRTAMYWLDVVIMMGSVVAATKGRRVKLQRLKRADTVSMGLSVAFSIVDAGLATKYLTTIPKGDNRGLEIANEVVSWLPGLLAPMRLAGPKGSAALGIVDVVAAFSNYTMGQKLLADDLAEI